MSDITEKIISYIKYLGSEANLAVSIHFTEDIFNRFKKEDLALLLPFNSHKNAYCTSVKRYGHALCLLNQKEIIKKCKGGEPFFSLCYAGVYEYVYPIMKDGESAGFIAVSGYRRESDGASIQNRLLWKISLSPNVISGSIADAVIAPLSVMLESFLQQNLDTGADEYNLILQFLGEYHTNISLSDLASHFGRSPSHISHLFKKKSGLTVRAYCNELKLSDAKKLLLSTDMSVTEVALESGFSDSSYFISLFRKKYGVSPLKLRQKK